MKWAVYGFVPFGDWWIEATFDKEEDAKKYATYKENFSGLGVFTVEEYTPTVPEHNPQIPEFYRQIL